MSIPPPETSSLPNNKVHFWIILSYKSKKSYTIYLKISQHKIANLRRTSGKKKKCLFHIKLLQKYFYPPKENEQYIYIVPSAGIRKQTAFINFVMRNLISKFYSSRYQGTEQSLVQLLSLHRKGHTENVYCGLEACPPHAKKE